MEDLCVTSIALSHWVNWSVVERINWHHHVEALLHENLFHVKYRMSIGSFNKLLDLLHPTLQLNDKFALMTGMSLISCEIMLHCPIHYLSGGSYHDILATVSISKPSSKASEETSCYPSALSFSTMKAGAHDKDIAALDCTLTRKPLKFSFAPHRWNFCLDVMLMKKSGVTDLSGLWTIVLFPVDCNFAFKHVGHQMMQVAKRTCSLAPEQYGSRRQHKAIDLAVNKALTFDILRQLKRAGAICSNDTKSCYNLIGHTQAAISMQRLGVPKNIINCLFTTLQEAIHRVRTGFGDSKDYYGGNVWLVPIHGIGQGNGVGPAIWAVVSTPLLNVLREKRIRM